MLSITRRSMTVDERATIERWAAAATVASTGVGWIILRLLITAIAAVGGAVVARLVVICVAILNTGVEGIPKDLQQHGYFAFGADMLIGMLIVVVVAVIVFLSHRRPRTSETYLHAMTVALESGEVEEIACTATAAAVIEDGGRDRPALFVLDVGDGKLVTVQASEVLPLVMTGAFPSTAFTVIRLPGREDIVRVEAAGEYLKPTRTREPLADGECFPGACAVLEGTLETLDTVLAAPAPTPAG